MIFPIGDDNADRTRTPFINYLLIAANVLVFILLQGMGGNEAFTYSYSTVPAEILSGDDIVTRARVVQDGLGNEFVLPGLGVTPIPVYLTLITSQFMHGGFLHLLGNLLFLWVFGDNIENHIGHLKYLIFYLLCGVIAALCHVFASQFLNDNLMIPSLGASGAISGVMGGYILLFPKRRVTILMLRWPMQVSALFAIGIWIVFQLVSGLGLLGGDESGVAYGAHIGGFFAGLILIKFFGSTKVARYRE